MSADAVGADLRAAGELNELCKLTAASDPAISTIDVGTPTGLYLECPWRSRPPSGYDHRERPWYTQAVDAGGLRWSSPYRDSVSHEPLISCCAPVYDHRRKLVAAISVNASLRTASAQIVTDGAAIAGQKVALLDRQLRVLASNREWKLGGQSVEELRLDAGSPEKTRLARERMVQQASELTSGRPGLVEARIGKEDAMVAYASVPSTRWLYVLALPKRAVVAPLDKVKDEIVAQEVARGREVGVRIGEVLVLLLAVFAIVSILALAASRRMADRIAGPVEVLSAGARAVGSGDLDHRFEVNTGDELDALAETFNAMTADLKQYMANLEETTAARERIQSELQMATTIQTSVLPRSFPAFPDRSEFDIFALMDPAREVGGDFYDFFFVDGTHFCFLVGDVSDKGVPAALLMMVTKTMLKSEALRGTAPDEILRRVNNLLAADSETGMFVTVFCAILDTETGGVSFSNAGHNPPLVCRDGQDPQFVPLPEGLPLGCMPGAEYSGGALTLAPGDALVVYTDGVTEARDPSRHFYGADRLERWLAQQPITDVTDLAAGLREEVARFGDGAEQADDITVLVVGFSGPAS